MSNIKKFILNNPIVAPTAIAVRKMQKDMSLYTETVRKIKSAKNPSGRIFYLGIPAHNNLGDLAQGVCIRRWLKKHYPDRTVVEIQTNAVVNTHFSVLKKLKDEYCADDFIVYQSGYTTTDLGGFADEMHRAVMTALPDAKMLMLPQTIFFKNNDNKKRTSEIYNSMKNMLFLARDDVSFEMAQEMFPDISVMVYPDIVTTLIGSQNFLNPRTGILFCCRRDSEKYYTDAEIESLKNRCSEFTKTEQTDTTKDGNVSRIVSNAESMIYAEIERYSKYQLIITDRYHGTILSLVAGTPVIILKTTDHKVVTGADWFKGVYDDYVYVADSLEDAYEHAKKVISMDLTHKLEPYFEREYYDNLPQLFQSIMQRNNK